MSCALIARDDGNEEWLVFISNLNEEWSEITAGRYDEIKIMET